MNGGDTVCRGYFLIWQQLYIMPKKRLDFQILQV